MKKKRIVAGKDWDFDGKTITVRIPMTWRRCLGAGKTEAGRNADPRAGAGSSMEADAGGGDASVGR